MIGKKVRVFWPVDSSWYIGTVQQYDSATGEHLLRYDDEDTEWVKIGESNTTAPPGLQHIRQAHAAPPPPPPPHDGVGVGQMLDEIPPPSSPSNHPSMMPPQSPHHGYGSYPPPPQADGPHSANSPDRKWHGPGQPPNYPPYQQGMYPHQAPPPGAQYQGSPYSGYQHGHPPPGGYYPSHMMGLPPHMAHDNSGPSSSPPGGPNSKRKNGPKAWTKEEDNLLLSIVQSMHMPMKWSVVAQSLPERTGKQCRERYVNHLNPRLKVTDWSPLEDATIFHLYDTIGSHWAKMSKIIPGRTDNGIKNRFHNLRRQLEREDEHRQRLSNARDFPDEIRLERMRKFPEDLKGKTADLWDMKSGLSVLAAQSVLGGNLARSVSKFGPFRDADDGDVCVRCGFMVPSLQTGTEVCTKTGWCQTCVRIPPHVCGNMLRECLNLRRAQDEKQREKVEAWEDPYGKETAASA